jgi:hypothetical protein
MARVRNGLAQPQPNVHDGVLNLHSKQERHRNLNELSSERASDPPTQRAKGCNQLRKMEA